MEAENKDTDSKGLQGLDRLTNVLALLLVKGVPQAEQIDMLNRAGFRDGQIAHLLGTTKKTVSVTKAKTKAKSRKSKGRKRNG
jgi:hypothetical protein